MSKRPKVSVVAISYNQEKFIEEALESFVKQETDFNIEIIISDDASTDRTPRIIKEYSKKYPTLFRPVLRKKNVGAAKNFVEALQLAKGDYIALCEGDDYFTDPKKLQMQADMLDNDPNLSLCFHKVKVFFDDHAQPDSVYPKLSGKRNFNTENLLRVNFIQTNSVMYRKRKYDSLPKDILPLDWLLHLYHAQYGGIGFINKVMSAYRRHAEGLWWQTSQDGIDEVWKKYGISHIKLYLELLKIYGDVPKYRNIIDAHVCGTLSAINRIDSTQKTTLLKDYVANLSGASDMYTLLLSLSEANESIQKKLEQSEVNQKTLEEKIKEMTNTISDLKQEKEAILQSRTFKVGSKISKIAGTLRIK